MEPRAYREVLGETLASLRSGIEVRVVEPREAAREARRLRADVVFSSQPPAPDAEDLETLWIETAPLTALEVGEAGLGTGDARGFGLEYVLSIVDEATGRPGRWPDEGADPGRPGSAPSRRGITRR